MTQLGLGEVLRVFLLDAKEDEKHSWRQLLVDDPGPPAEVGGDAVDLLFYTSGTTGRPKGVPLSHANLISEVRAIKKTRLLKEGDRMLLPLPLHHVYPFVIGVLTPRACWTNLNWKRSIICVISWNSLRNMKAMKIKGPAIQYKASTHKEYGVWPVFMPAALKADRMIRSVLPDDQE